MIISDVQIVRGKAPHGAKCPYIADVIREWGSPFSKGWMIRIQLNVCQVMAHVSKTGSWDPYSDPETIPGILAKVKPRHLKNAGFTEADIMNLLK